MCLTDTHMDIKKHYRQIDTHNVVYGRLRLCYSDLGNYIFDACALGHDGCIDANRAGISGRTSIITIYLTQMYGGPEVQSVVFVARFTSSIHSLIR